jgi:hypothetical protein
VVQKDIETRIHETIEEELIPELATGEVALEQALLKTRENSVAFEDE